MKPEPLTFLDIVTAVSISENPEFDKKHTELNPKYVKIERINSALEWFEEQILNAEPPFRDEDSIICLARQALMAVYEEYYE